MPDVSIVIPVYNQRADFLRACINSALSQTYGEFELLISDNHSTNGSSEVIAEFEDARIRVVKPEQHLKMVAHFDFAASQAAGRYISFLSSDDILEPDWLASVYPALTSSPNAVFAFGEIACVQHENPNAILFACRDNTMASGEYSPEQLLELVIPLTSRAGWFVGDLIRKDVFDQVGGMSTQGLMYCGDHSLALKFIEKGGAVYVNRLFGRHRVWRSHQGKQDADCSVQWVEEVSILFDMISKNKVFLRDPDRFLPLLAKSRRRNAFILAVSLLTRSRPQMSDGSDQDALKSRILEIDDSLPTRTLLVMMNNSLFRTLTSAAKSFAQRIRFLLPR